MSGVDLIHSGYTEFHALQRVVWKRLTNAIPRANPSQRPLRFLTEMKSEVLQQLNSISVTLGQWLGCALGIRVDDDSSGASNYSSNPLKGDKVAQVDRAA